MLSERSQPTHRALSLGRSITKYLSQKIPTLRRSDNVETCSKDFYPFFFSVLSCFGRSNYVIAAMQRTLAGFSSVEAINAFKKSPQKPNGNGTRISCDEQITRCRSFALAFTVDFTTIPDAKERVKLFIGSVAGVLLTT